YVFLINDTPHTLICPLSLLDALPICEDLRAFVAPPGGAARRPLEEAAHLGALDRAQAARAPRAQAVPIRAFEGSRGPRRSRADRDRKSTRLNSSHVKISYAVFCLKKK